MNTVTINHLENRVKKEAKALLLALKLVSPSTDSLYQLEPSLRLPSLKQCYEIIATGYGFKTYNGLCDFIVNGNSNKIEDYNSQIIEASLRKFLIRENTKDTSGLFSLLDPLNTKDKIDQIIKDVHYILPTLRAFPVFNGLKFPKRSYVNEFNFYWTGTESNYFVNKLHEVTFNLIFSFLIENYDEAEFIRYEDKTMFALPISCFYCHKINDYNKVRDIVIDIEDLINSSKIIKISSGYLDFDNLENSHINITMSNELANNLEVISNVVKTQNDIIVHLNSLLLDHSKQEQDFLDKKLNKNPLFLKRLDKHKGFDQVGYQLLKYICYTTLLLTLDLPIGNFSIHRANFEKKCTLVDLGDKFKQSDFLISNTITIFNSLFITEIFRFIERYQTYQKEALALAKFHIDKLSGKIENPEIYINKLEHIHQQIRLSHIMLLSALYDENKVLRSKNI